MQINSEWHRDRPMPKNPTFEQKVAWHLEHQKKCACRPIPGKLMDKMKERGIEILN